MHRADGCTCHFQLHWPNASEGDTVSLVGMVSVSMSGNRDFGGCIGVAVDCLDFSANGCFDARSRRGQVDVTWKVAGIYSDSFEKFPVSYHSRVVEPVS